MTDPLDLARLLAARHEPRRNRLPWTTVVVGEHEHAVLHRRGRVAGVLPPGLHRLWGWHVQVVRHDRRRRLL